MEIHYCSLIHLSIKCVSNEQRLRFFRSSIMFQLIYCYSTNSTLMIVLIFVFLSFQVLWKSVVLCKVFFILYLHKRPNNILLHLSDEHFGKFIMEQKKGQTLTLSVLINIYCFRVWWKDIKLRSLWLTPSLSQWDIFMGTLILFHVNGLMGSLLLAIVHLQYQPIKTGADFTYICVL